MQLRQARLLAVLLFFLFLIPSSTTEGSTVSLAIQDSSQPPTLPALSTSSLSTATVRPPNVLLRFNGTISGNANPWYPPDVQVAAGPNYVVQTVNSMVTVYTKQGVLAKATTLQSFFNLLADHLFDSRILYDTNSQRWFLSTEDFSTGILYLAVSKTIDPTGDWWTLPFSSTPNCPAGQVPDQPTLGVSDDKIAVSVNGCFGVQYWIFNKSDLLNGQSVYVASIPDLSVYSVHPAQALTSTTTLYMVTTYDGHGNSARLFSITGVPPDPITIITTDIAISPTIFPPRAPQLGSYYPLDTGDNRVLDAKWNEGLLWVSLNDSCIPSGDTQTRSCVRLIQIDTLIRQVTQDFDAGSAGQYYFYPAVSPDGHGDLLVVFGQASPTSYPGLMVATQLARDRRDALEQPAVLAVGAGPETTSCTAGRGCRYGDYFEATQDPSNSAIVWVAGQYGTTSFTWATIVAALSVHHKDPTQTNSNQVFA